MKPQLTVDNYYDDTHYMSSSSYQRFIRCEAEALTPFPPPTTPMLIGSYVDAYVEGTLREFREENPEIFSTRGASKGRLKSEFRKAEEICKYIDDNPVFSQFMSGEKQVIFTGVIGGVDWKVKLDSYSKGIAINDLKVLKTVTNRCGEYIDFITPWGYDIQLAIYQEIVYQNTGERLPVYDCAVTKETPIDSVIVNVPQQRLDFLIYDIEKNIERVMDVKNGVVQANRCEKCKYCRSTRVKTPIICLSDLE